LSTCLVVLVLPFIDGGQFWHISDLHLDYEYIKGGDMSNWCHQMVDNNTTTSINSDIVGPAGNYHCDSPSALVESALLAMKRLNPNPDFIVWTGDSAPHWRDPVPNEDYILNVTKSVFSKLDKLFPSVSIIPALGNHDASPPDQFPQYNPEDKAKPEYYMKFWQQGAYGDHINDTEARENFQKCGFYSKMVSPSNSSKKLKFIVLNTNMYYHDNFTKGKDPCGQLDWLSSTLDSVDIEKEKVFIVAHVPPGSFERQPGLPNFNSPEDHKTEINKQFVQIVTDPKYANKISAHLYGHLHTDTFRVFLDRATRREPVGVAFMAGSVTPVVWANGKVVGVNPTIRLMEYSDLDATMKDYQEYSLDIIKAAKNESVSETVKNKALLVETSSDDSSNLPKSRRKNAKFLKQSEKPVNDNLERKTRESLDTENPATDARITISSTTTTQPVNNPTSPTTVQAVVGEGVPAVPTTINTTKAGGEEAENKATEIPTVAEVDNNANDTVAITSKPAVEKEEESGATNNVSQDNTTTATATDLNNGTTTVGPNDGKNDTIVAVTTATTEKSTSIKAESDPDYPTYLATQWTLLYKASTSFSVQNLSPTSMFSALGLMVKGGHESQIFVNYYEHNTGGHIVEKCNETCWRQQLCTVSNLVMDELATCLKSNGTDGFFEVHKTPTIPTTPTKKLFGEGDDDPDHEVHGVIDHSHDHNGDGSEDHSHDNHAVSSDDHNEEFHDHNDDGLADHDHNDHAESEEKDVSREKLEDTTSDISSKAVAIFFGVFAVAIVALAAAMGYKKYRDNRYRNQEFLLTDAVFRYDGYSQLDDA